MPVRTSPPAFDEAALRAETEQRRTAYQTQMERDRRLLVGIIGLVLILGAIGLATLARAFGN